MSAETEHAVTTQETAERRWRYLEIAACISVTVHIAAAIAMLFLLRNGLDTNEDFHSRCTYIVQHRALWTVGWLCWNLSAIAILNYFIAYAQAHTQPISMVLRLAIGLAIAGVANDLAAESLEMGLIPQLAQDALTSLSGSNFLCADRIVVLLSGYVANSLYTLATLFSIASTRADYQRWIVIAGALVVVAGAAISLTCLSGSVAGMFWSNALLVPCLVTWQVGVALDACGRRRKKASVGPD